MKGVCSMRFRNRLMGVQLAVHVLIGLIAVAQIAFGVEYFWFIWISPTILAVYTGLRAWPLLPQPVRGYS
jgi:hypothetical protein